MSAAAIVAKDLIDHKAVKISIDPPFTWASGIKSPIYCDNRMMIAFPEARETIVSEFMVAIDHMKPDYIAGTATAGIPWAAFVAYQMKLPMVYVRPKPKEHGAGKQIEGYLEPGKKVVLVEDLISTGGSSIRAAQALQEEGQAIVEDIVAIVTYEMKKADDAFAESGIKLTTLTDFSHLLAEVKKQGYLNEDQVALVQQFGADPASWWGNFSK
jgi:orotidine-5'-phosphate decarboxylase